MPLLKKEYDYYHYSGEFEVSSKEFLQWYITLRITGFLDFVHCLVFQTEQVVWGTGSAAVFRKKCEVQFGIVDYGDSPETQ
jgi:hypothetical protein